MKVEDWLVNFHSLGIFCMDISIFCNKFQVYFNDQILYCPIKLDHLRRNLRGLKSVSLEDMWGSEALKEAVIDGEREPL